MLATALIVLTKVHNDIVSTIDNQQYAILSPLVRRRYLYPNHLSAFLVANSAGRFRAFTNHSGISSRSIRHAAMLV